MNARASRARSAIYGATIVRTLADRWRVWRRQPPARVGMFARSLVRSKAQASPTAATRNFLLAVEAVGGTVYETDAMLSRWACEWDQAERMGLITCPSAWSINSMLTARGRRYLAKLRASDCAALRVLGLH